MGLWFTMVPMLTPITPIVLRYGSHFLKEGVMGLADSVTTFVMQQRPRSMKNSPVFRCPLKRTYRIWHDFHKTITFYVLECGEFNELVNTTAKNHYHDKKNRKVFGRAQSIPSDFFDRKILLTADSIHQPSNPEAGMLTIIPTERPIQNGINLSLILTSEGGKGKRNCYLQEDLCYMNVSARFFPLFFA